MPNMISLRNFRLETTTGHIVLFKAGEAAFVPDAAVSAAMAAGCVPEDKGDIPFYEDASRAVVEFHGDVRKSVIYLAVEAVCKVNDSKEFDGAGVPQVKVIAGKLGFDVNRAEVVDALQVYSQAKAEGREFPVHPAASNITRVIEADTKAELIELAAEFDVPEDKIKGLVVRDLRKFLLVKFSGIAA